MMRDRQSAEYRAAREDLLAAEIELKDQRERVAELRRRLPQGAALETDYAFREGPSDLSQNASDSIFETRLWELFAAGKDELIVQHMMFAPDWEQGCPMCSMWVDGIDGVAHHLADRTNFAVVARAPIEKLRSWGARRGWRRVRLLSSSENAFNGDLGVESSEQSQYPALSVFKRMPSGEILHTYTSEGSLVESHHRAMDLYSPVWNLLDLLPSGRGAWMPRHFYSD